jgi:hypothetical protein
LDRRGASGVAREGGDPGGERPSVIPAWNLYTRVHTTSFMIYSLEKRTSRVVCSVMYVAGAGG